MTAIRPTLAPNDPEREYKEYMMTRVDTIHARQVYTITIDTCLAIAFLAFAAMKYFEKEEIKRLRDSVMKFTGVASGILKIIQGWIDVHVRDNQAVADKAQEVARGLEERLPKATAQEVVNTIKAHDSASNLPTVNPGRDLTSD